MLLFFTLLLLLLRIQLLFCYCPPYDLLKPCYCHSRAQSIQNCNYSQNSSFECHLPIITCAGDQPFNLSNVFQKVNNNITEESHKYFDWFYLSNTAITELDGNTLWGIKFRNIYIRQCSQLMRINRFSFNNSSKFVKNIWINATKLSDELIDKRNSFKAFNSLTELKSLEVIGSQFTSIPSKAFNEYSTLKSISFNNNKANERQWLERIHSKAFHRLSDLRQIDLRNNRISRISSFAFAFETHSNHTLRIHLENNYLKSDSFNRKSFLGGNGRRIILYLGGYNECNTNLNRLDEEVFKSFLLENRKNIIELYGCPIECDGSALWMDQRKKFLTKRIRHLKCIPNITLKKVLNNNNNHKNTSNNYKNSNKIKDKLSKRSENLKLENKPKIKKNSLKNPMKNSLKNPMKNPMNKEKTKPKMTLKIRLGL